MKKLLILALLGSSSLMALEPNTYVDQAEDFTITTDQGSAGLDAGDTVTWHGASGPVTGLVFGTDAFTVIQPAVDAVQTGGTVYLASGTYTDAPDDVGNTFKQVVVGRNMTIQGEGAANTVLSQLPRFLEVDGVVFPDPLSGIMLVGGNADTVVTINDLTIRDGLTVATGSGLSVLDGRTAIVNRCFFTENGSRAVNSSGFLNTTGAIRVYPGARLVLNDSTLAYNKTAANGGAGIYSDGGRVTLNNSTLLRNNNVQGFSPKGGAIYATGTNHSLIINHSTIISNNTTPANSAIFIGQTTGVLILNNSIVANQSNNLSSKREFFFFNSAENSFDMRGVNFIGNAEFGPNSDDYFRPGIDLSWQSTGTTYEDLFVNAIPVDLSYQIYSNPGLDPLLSYNGGPTPTLALQSDSPLIDAGSNGSIPTGMTEDQLGFARIANGTVDIGAIEFTPPATPPELLLVSPNVSASPIQLDTHFELTFDQTIQIGSGAVVLRREDNNEIIPATVSIEGNFLTITPNSPLPEDGVRFFIDGLDAITGTTGIAYVETPPPFSYITTFLEAYVDALVDYTITVDQGAAGLDTGDTVTWNGANGAVPNLIFGSNAFSSIQEAVDGVSEGGTVFIAEGTYMNGSQISLRIRVTIQGDGTSETVISGEDSYRVINIFVDNVTINDLSIVDGQSNGNGAGIRQGGSAVLNRVMMSGNSTSADSSGGAVYSEKTLDLNECTLANNSASLGGAIYNQFGRVSVRNSTLSGNNATNRGGAIFINFLGGAELRIIQSTLTGNSAGDRAGAIFNQNGSTEAVVFQNSLIAGNHSDSPLDNDDLGGGDRNLNPDGDDLSDFYSEGVNFIGDAAGFTNFRSGVDLSFANTGTTISDVLNTTLADNGGVTMTHALAFGSPAANGGDNSFVPAGLTEDQRGFDRIRNGTVDIGAFEALFDVYVDQAGDFSPANPASGDPVTWNGAHRTVTGLTFGLDAFPTIQSGLEGLEAAGTVFIAAGDYFEGSQIEINHSVNLQGDGADLTILSGNRTHRVMRIPESSASVALSDLALVDGNTAGGLGNSGGAISNFFGAELTINNVAFIDNVAALDGGAIINAGGGFITITNALFSGNQAADDSGAIHIQDLATLDLRNTTISGNSATGDGGAIAIREGNFTSLNSTITGNSAGTSVGGIFVGSNSTITLENTIVAGNTASEQAADLSTSGTTVTVDTNGAANFIGSLNDATFTGGPGNQLTFTSGQTIADVLAPLADNGGPLLTHALVIGSPASGAGRNDSLPGDLLTDQRGVGFERVFLSNVDLGAFEQQTDLLDDSDGDGNPLITELALGTNPFLNDPSNPNNFLPPVLDGGDEIDLDFGRIGTGGSSFDGVDFSSADFIWIVERSSTLQPGSFEEIYRFDGRNASETRATNITSIVTDTLFTITDEDPPEDHAFYRLEIQTQRVKNGSRSDLFSPFSR